jgi:hypothetical protein
MESPATAEEADDSCRANSVQESCSEYFNHLGSPACQYAGEMPWSRPREWRLRPSGRGRRGTTHDRQVML